MYDHGAGKMQGKRRESQIPAGEFKSKCLQIMDEVQKLRTHVVITKHGKPVAMLVPCEEQPTSLFGCFKGSVKSYGNIIDPVEVKWQANE